MPLILITLMSFAIVGLAARRFGGPQQAAIAVIAVILAIVQLSLPQFL